MPDFSNLYSRAPANPDTSSSSRMPYNTSAILPQKEATGTSQLPLSRIKKIIALDHDINMCSNNASFVITLATEMFIQHLAEQGHNVVKSERKPRRNIQYRDLATAVAHHDNLEFLVDIVPRTMTHKQFKENKARTTKNGTGKSAAGQKTLDSAGRLTVAPVNGVTLNGYDGAGDERDDGPGPNEQLEMEIRRSRTSISEINGVNGGEKLQERPDIEMS
ncbi:histone-like transcription factor and archaeal histone [Phlyctema vagabunda]|uniref:Histone-like transcription factor and archaeal histone n=1 Tax=Phlyctema vagabunda TaxID=108571 RepID=A0ABR4P8X6_9HELO